MIRLVYFLRRKQGMSFEDFLGHLRDVRGPLLASHSRDLQMRRCVHSYFAELSQDEGARRARGAAAPYDALEEIWFDSVEEADAVFNSPEGGQAMAELVEDERHVVDFSRSSLWFAVELPQINPTPEDIAAREDSSVTKIAFPLRPSRRLSDQEAQFYWLSSHGPLIRSLAPFLGIMRYLQVHHFSTPLAEQLRAARGAMEEPYIGHAEVWFDRLAPPRKRPAPGNPRVGSLVLADEATFIDLSRSTTFMTKEVIVFEAQERLFSEQDTLEDSGRQSRG